MRFALSLWLFFAVLALQFAAPACAHETRPGYLELRETAAGRYDLLWKRPSGGEVEIRIAPAVPDGCRFDGGEGVQLTPGAVVVRGELNCTDGLAGKTLSITGLQATITDVLVLSLIHI